MIQSNEDAECILDAVNKGSLELTVPLLSLKKTKVVANLSGTLGYWFKGLFATIIDGTMYCVTRGNYNPFHIKPISAVKNLRGKIKCPVLIHQCTQDGVLKNPDADTVKLYDALREGNEDQTHIILSKNDGGWHNALSIQHVAVQNKFREQYGIEQNLVYKHIQDDKNLFARTQPSIDQLWAQIFSTLSDRE